MNANKFIKKIVTHNEGQQHSKQTALWKLLSLLTIYTLSKLMFIKSWKNLTENLQNVLKLFSHFSFCELQQNIFLIRWDNNWKRPSFIIIRWTIYSFNKDWSFPYVLGLYVEEKAVYLILNCQRFIRLVKSK